MTEEEKEFFDSCKTFQNYKDIDEYIADIQRWLTLSDWHYSLEEAVGETKEENHAEWIRTAFLVHEPVDSIAADVGYSCG